MTTKHLFSVDVEDYFQVYAFERYVRREDWGSYPSRVERNTHLLLDLLAQHGHTGTFFTLGWVAERFPALVRRIVDAGHEIASHGFWHRKITSLSPQEFREDIATSKAILEQTSGHAVVGFRAPSFSITPSVEWAFEILLEEGYRYDSSLFPIKRNNYGYPGTPPLAHYIHCANGDLLEFPLATARFGRTQVPAAGGGYFRHFPYRLTRKAFQQAFEAKLPAMFYIHPWEVDPEQPRIKAPLLTRVRHYRNIDKTIPRLNRLLSEFTFSSVERQLVETNTWLRHNAQIAPALSPSEATSELAHIA